MSQMLSLLLRSRILDNNQPSTVTDTDRPEVRNEYVLPRSICAGPRRSLPLTAPASERAAQQLPVLLTSFVGRERELAAITRPARCSPMSGFSRLPVPGAWARRALPCASCRRCSRTFPRRDLVRRTCAGCRSHASCWGRWRSVLGVRNADGRPFLDLIVAAIGRERTLIVLDNRRACDRCGPRDWRPARGLPRSDGLWPPAVWRCALAASASMPSSPSP